WTATSEVDISILQVDMVQMEQQNHASMEQHSDYHIFDGSAGLYSISKCTVSSEFFFNSTHYELPSMDQLIVMLHQQYVETYGHLYVLNTGNLASPGIFC